MAAACAGDDHGDVRQSLRSVDVIEDASTERKHSCEPRTVSWLLWLVAALFVVYFAIDVERLLGVS